MNVPIQRHRTAMVRHTLSKPMSLLVQHGVVRPGVDVFDYGCGQGDDLRALAAAGVEAAGWDPHFAATSEKRPAQVVNLGFVLNVIEDEDERREALRGSWELAQRVLAVATMVVGQVPTEGLTPYRDGFLTSRGTFQKYFQHSELRSLIAETLGGEPMALAPGTFLLFREAEEQEEFLLRRRMGRRFSTGAFRPPPRTPSAKRSGPALAERIGPALEAIARLANMRGRIPHPEELPADIVDLLATERVSLQRAFDICLGAALDPSELERSAMAMREDLLVHYALGRLNRSATAERPSPAMVRDIRAHFGSQRELVLAATDYLMSLADPGLIVDATLSAQQEGLGAIDEKGRLVVDSGRMDELPGVLRVYIGCASYLAGEPEADALVRVDPAKRRVAFFPVEERSAALPVLSGVVSIDLRRQHVALSDAKRVLVRKSDVLFVRDPKQRAREQEYRDQLGLAENVVLHRLAH